MQTIETNYLVKTIHVTGFIPQRNSYLALINLRTRYRYDIKQALYFVITTYQNIFDVIGIGIMELFKQSQQLGKLVPEHLPYGC